MQALSPEWAVIGNEFIQEMITLAHMRKVEIGLNGERYVQFITEPIFGTLHWRAAPAQFGKDLNNKVVVAEARTAIPFRACQSLSNAQRMRGNIAVVQRQDCMFQEKARYAQESGAVGIIIIDNTVGTSIDESPPFAMSLDQTVKDDIVIPAVFLYNREGLDFMDYLSRYPNGLVRLSDRLANPSYLFEEFFMHAKHRYLPRNLDLLKETKCSTDIIMVDNSSFTVVLNFRFATVTTESDIEHKQKVVEDNIAEMKKLYSPDILSETETFYNVIRQIAYWQLGLNTQPTEAHLKKFYISIPTVIRQQNVAKPKRLPGPITTVVCRLWDKHFDCKRSRGC